MLPSFPLAAALLDQYALLTAAAMSNQQQQQPKTLQQEQQAQVIEALWPSLLYSRLLAANSSTASLSPPTPPNTSQGAKSRKYRGFSVKDLLEGVEQPGEISTPDPASQSEMAQHTTPPPSTSPKKLHDNQGPLDELCKLASRPIEENQQTHQQPSSLLVGHSLMLPSPSSTTLSRTIGDFGSCPNLDQATTSNIAAAIFQQQRFARQAVAAVASVIQPNPLVMGSTNNHHQRFHHPVKASLSTGSLGNVVHSLSLVRRKRKTRTSFTPHQIAELEKRFFKQKYLTSSDRDELASTLNLTAGQVITWFQNRRAKLKRDIEEIKSDMKLDGNNNNSMNSLTSPSPPSPDGSYIEEDEGDLIMDDGPIGRSSTSHSFKALHAFSEPSIHHLVSAAAKLSESKKSQ